MSYNELSDWSTKAAAVRLSPTFFALDANLVASRETRVSSLICIDRGRAVRRRVVKNFTHRREQVCLRPGRGLHNRQSFDESIATGALRTADGDVRHLLLGGWA